ncbi:MAG: CidA/LrgA family protein [Betaproteobacteria bacterium]|nr:CidA/LrgA family protein [Betaproteobacteria bacterium]
MIRGLIILLGFQGVGEIISRLFSLPIPGPVIGLVLLLVFLIRRGKVDAPIDTVALALTKHLGLLFVPAAVGVVMYWPQLKTHLWAVSVALIVSVIATIAASAAILRFWPGGKSPS